jgi:hypothetical protein
VRLLAGEGTGADDEQERGAGSVKGRSTRAAGAVRAQRARFNLSIRQ